MKIEDIKIGKRHRKSLGNIEKLAASIDAVGLLHPPVVTSGGVLVCGERRVKACDRLGWEDVEVRVINCESLLQAEHDENELREEFTASERVSIARELEREIGSRQGQRTDKGELVGNCPQVEPGKKTRDHAAKAAGFKSTDEFRRAAKVVDKGTPELVDAMDKKEVSASAAAEVADLPKNEQREAVKTGTVKTKAAEKRKATTTKPEAEPKPPEPTDPGEEFVSGIETLCRDMDQIVARMKAVKTSPFSYSIHVDSSVNQVEAARKTFWQGRPAHPCPYCRANEEVSKTCRACKGTNRVKKGTYDAGVSAVGGAA